MYYNVAPEDLIFLSPTDHIIIHNKTRSAETKKKIAVALKGRKRTAEERKKLSDFAKTRVGNKNPNFGNKGIKNPLYNVPKSAEHRQKISASQKGKHWFNNGICMTFCINCPAGYVAGKLNNKRN